MERVGALGPSTSDAFLVRDQVEVPAGYGLYLFVGQPLRHLADTDRYVVLPSSLEYVGDGDVVSISDDGNRINVLWRRESYQNSILLTERCNHFCLMCSQPPKSRNDDYLMDEAFELIRLLPRGSKDIGFTGGEPTLYGERLIELIRLAGNLLPETSVHVLSNGRRFFDPLFADAWAGIRHPDLMVGIPIYGPESTLHDYVVQSAGAFHETIGGILNLAERGQRIELRIVLHKKTIPQLEETAAFVSRNLPFVDQVSLMGLEIMGFARANLEDIWIDPVDYQRELKGAVSLLESAGVRVLLFNQQHCLTAESLWPFLVRSISDWKNEFHQECIDCAAKHLCGGFFASSKYRVSPNVRAISEEAFGKRDRQAVHESNQLLGA